MKKENKRREQRKNIYFIFMCLDEKKMVRKKIQIKIELCKIKYIYLILYSIRTQL